MYRPLESQLNMERIYYQNPHFGQTLSFDFCFLPRDGQMPLKMLLYCSGFYLYLWV